MARTSRSATVEVTHKIRAWRKFRGLTLEALAEAIEMSSQNLGRIERGIVPLGEEHHAKLARALEIEVADLFRDPDEEDRSGREVNHLRAWREFRQMAKEDLAAAIKPPTTESVISLLEEGKQKLSPKWLRRLAPVLGTTPGFLLDHDPNNLPTDFLDVIARIPDERKDQALQILETFTRTGTGG